MHTVLRCTLDCDADSLSRSVVESLAQHPNTKVAVLSSRSEIAAWGATVWFVGDSFNDLCHRFRKIQKNNGRAAWVVVIDTGDCILISKEYNRMFRNGNPVSVLTITPRKEVARDHRYDVTVDVPEYVAVPVAGSPTDPQGSWWWPF